MSENNLHNQENENKEVSQEVPEINPAEKTDDAPVSQEQTKSGSVEEQPETKAAETVSSDDNTSSEADKVAEEVPPTSGTESQTASAPVDKEPQEVTDKVELGVTAEATAKMEEALKAEPTAEELAAREETEKIAAAKKEENKKKYQEYKAKVGTGETLSVNVLAKVRGGLRVVRDDFQMFLPASLLSSARVEDTELDQIVGKDLVVEIVDSDDERQSIVVSRKSLVEKEAWEKINVGDIVKGRVTSVPAFGVFVDLGGIEGLLHVSRISHKHVDNPQSMFKKGDEVEVKITEINKSKGKISLSRKELEESPWKGASEEFPNGSTHKGKVKNLTNFGGYIEMKPGVEGLVRMNELSWTRRINQISDVMKTGDELEFYVIGVNEEKGQADLSIKRLTSNPWDDVAEKYKIGETYKGKVAEIFEKGARVTINDEIDAFMPMSRMRPILKNGVVPYQLGQDVEVVVVDLSAEQSSMIIAPKVEGKDYSQDNSGGRSRDDRGGRKGGSRRKENIPKEHDGNQSGSFSLGDMLGNLFEKDQD